MYGYLKLKNHMTFHSEMLLTLVKADKYVPYEENHTLPTAAFLYLNGFFFSPPILQ
jgi:hypothetical protein